MENKKQIPLKFRHSKEGFSLVEVIIAVTLLAVLALPVLAYFTNAAVSASKGKDTQKANMAAQSVTEELNSCTSFQQIEEELVAATGSAWTVEAAADAVNRQSRLSKEVIVDGTAYEAKVTVDYEYETKNVNGDDTASQFNDYEVPQLKEVYSSSNVVIAETDQADTAVSNFLYRYPEDSVSSIRSGMKRTLCLDIIKGSVTAGEDGIYQVKGSYEYSYKDKTYSSVIEDTKIEVEKLENIYYFYNLIQTDIPEDVKVNFSDNVTIEEAKKLSIYFVCQKKIAEPGPGYSLRFSGSGVFLLPKYFTNGITADTVAEESEIIEHSKGDRIAKITVDIYDQGETTFTDETRLVRLETSKGA